MGLMTDTQPEQVDFFERDQFDRSTVEQHAALAFASPRDRERFERRFREFQERAGSGQADSLKVGLALYLLGRYGEAIESLERAGDSALACFYAGDAATTLGRYEEAIEFFKRAADGGWDRFECDMRVAEAQVRGGDVTAAEKLIGRHESTGQQSPAWFFVRGLIAEKHDQRQPAADLYESALGLDPHHAPTLFRCAYLYDIRGDDERAIELYERLTQQPRAAVNALINLTVIYEDNGEYQKAAHCLRRVLAVYPNHARARLFYRDVQSSLQMVIDEGVAKRAERRNRLLETPISEFELSVRARNCLKKMNIQTLGDLVRLSEPELLSYKNFGETSLTEIRALLDRRGLRLGQPPEEIDALLQGQPAIVEPQPRVNVPPGSEIMLSKPVSELELSVRARRCLQRLNISTIGDLIQHTEPELLSTRNFGVTSLNEIKGRLAELGLSLAPKQ
jgi:DNA-directed RNA polymerase subunit alpha